MGSIRTGNHNVISDYSGFKFKRSEMRYTWDGKLVHKSEWEPKQPQLDIRPPRETIAIAVEGVRVPQEDPALLNPPITTAQML